MSARLFFAAPARQCRCLSRLDGGRDDLWRRARLWGRLRPCSFGAARGPRAKADRLRGHRDRDRRRKSPDPASTLHPQRRSIERCFSAATLPSILANLDVAKPCRLGLRAFRRSCDTLQIAVEPCNRSASNANRLPSSTLTRHCGPSSGSSRALPEAMIFMKVCVRGR